MIMKQLFRHTSSLLRTALLLGAAALFNVLPTQAMTEAELKEMLNAFETKTPTIDDGQYYYIQYYILYSFIVLLHLIVIELN